MSSSRFVLLVVVHVSNCYSNGFRKGSRAFRAVTYWVRSVALWRCPSSGWTADHGHGNLDFLQLTVGVEKRFWQITWVISESTHKLSRNLWCATACRGWRFGQESDAASCSLPLLLEYQCNSRSSQSIHHNATLNTTIRLNFSCPGLFWESCLFCYRISSLTNRSCPNISRCVEW